MQCKTCLKMEIDKKIIKKLIDALEELKKSTSSEEFSSSKDIIEEEIDTANTVRLGWLQESRKYLVGLSIA